jgi:hypothetical protein
MAKAIPTPLSNHSLPALVLLRKPLFGQANRRQPRTLCEIQTELVRKEKHKQKKL